MYLLNFGPGKLWSVGIILNLINFSLIHSYIIIRLQIKVFLKPFNAFKTPCQRITDRESVIKLTS